MRVVLQRVTSAAVSVDGEVCGSIEKGLLALVGIEDSDTDADLAYMCDKVSGLRIFEDADGKMNLSVKDIGGSILAVSQFTLYGDCRKGKRPSFSSAGKPEYANEMYEKFMSLLKNEGIRVEKGIFGADMKVSLVNDGPVTLLVDSKKNF